MVVVLGRGAILGVGCGEILWISLPGLGRVNAKNVNKLTDLNTAVSSPASWAVGSYSSGPSARGNAKILSFKTFRQTG